MQRGEFLRRARPAAKGLLFLQRDGDGVEIVESTGCNGHAVAYGIFVIADNPIGPGFTRAGHGVHIQDAHFCRLLIFPLRKRLSEQTPPTVFAVA